MKMISNIFTLKRIIILLSILLFIYTFVLIGLLYSTGHQINFFSLKNFELLFITSLFLLTGIFILFYLVKKNIIIRYISIVLLFVSGLAILYNIYLLLSVEPSFFDIIFILFLILFTLFLNMRTLYLLVVPNDPLR